MTGTVYFWGMMEGGMASELPMRMKTEKREGEISTTFKIVSCGRGNCSIAAIATKDDSMWIFEGGHMVPLDDIMKWKEVSCGENTIIAIEEKSGRIFEWEITSKKRREIALPVGHSLAISVSNVPDHTSVVCEDGSVLKVEKGSAIKIPGIENNITSVSGFCFVTVDGSVLFQKKGTSEFDRIPCSIPIFQ